MIQEILFFIAFGAWFITGVFYALTLILFVPLYIYFSFRKKRDNNDSYIFNKDTNKSLPNSTSDIKDTY